MSATCSAAGMWLSFDQTQSYLFPDVMPITIKVLLFFMKCRVSAQVYRREVITQQQSSMILRDV